MGAHVLIIGSGIAGVTAAIEAARAGAQVTIACAGPLFSGSSFYPGTWGLGLVGPENQNDEQDFIDTICRVGGGVEDRSLVSTFVHDILPAISWLEEDLGVELKRPESEQSAQEDAFIPCFDHKHRTWRGITRQSFEKAVQQEFAQRAIEILPHHELLTLQDCPGEAVFGAMLYDMHRRSIKTIDADAVILACGGTSGLFERRLTSRDVLSSVHGAALLAGASMVNLEFMQMMPGLVAPKRGLVFNEKTFRYVQHRSFADIAPDELPSLLEQRSGHGPFTARLDDRRVDLAIDAAGADGLPLTYVFPATDMPEFVQVFCDWLQNEHGISPSDELRVAMYAHASNGGIRIDEDGWTGIAGLYACGEATGGMHGADRIGGLSSANGLVFGRRAGRAAAAYAKHPAHAPQGLTSFFCSGAPTIEEANTLTQRLRATMSEHAMICRTEAGLVRALHDIDEIERDLDACAGISNDDAGIARSVRLLHQITLARTMLSAMRSRTHSLGSHYRADDRA